MKEVIYLFTKVYLPNLHFFVISILCNFWVKYVRTYFLKVRLGLARRRSVVTNFPGSYKLRFLIAHKKRSLPLAETFNACALHVKTLRFETRS